MLSASSLFHCYANSESDGSKASPPLPPSITDHGNGSRLSQEKQQQEHNALKLPRTPMVAAMLKDVEVLENAFFKSLGLGEDYKKQMRALFRQLCQDDSKVS